MDWFGQKTSDVAGWPQGSFTELVISYKTGVFVDTWVSVFEDLYEIKKAGPLLKRLALQAFGW